MIDHYTDVSDGGFLFFYAKAGPTLTPLRATELTEQFGYKMRSFAAVDDISWTDFKAEREAHARSQE